MKEPILVVEDVVDFRNTLLLALRRAGYEAVGAEDGLEAVELATEKFFPVIVSDIRLPQMDGIDALHKIRESQQGNRSRMVVMSGHSDYDRLIKAIHVGVDNFLRKPFGLEEFLHVIDDSIALYRLEHERGQHLEMIRSFNDELIAKNEQISAILASLADGVFTVDEQMRITHINRAAEILLCQRAETVIGRPCREVFHNNLCSEGCPMQRAIERHAPALGIETTFQKVNGQEVHVLLSATALRDSAGNVVGGVEAFRDNTERNAMVAELSRSRDKIQALNVSLEQRVEERTRELLETNHRLSESQEHLLQAARLAAIGQLGAGVAHEMSNPIGGIVLYTQFLLKAFGDGGCGHEDLQKVRRYLEMIEAESLRCKAILENLRLFSRKPLSSEAEPCDVHEIIESALVLARQQSGLSTVDIIKDFAGDAPKVRGNSRRLEQVFMNLFLNAYRAMADGGEVSITTRIPMLADEASNRYIAVEVSDTGLGISEDDIGRIFEPLFTTRNDETSLGLGLYAVKWIVEDCGGTVEVESRVGKGTVFTVLLRQFL